MGKRRVRHDKTITTLDLGYEKTYEIETPDSCGVRIGKLHGIGARDKQQDSFGISELKEDVIEEKGIMAILADGMGGMSSGEQASMAAVISCLHYFDSHGMEEQTPETLIDMARNANLEVRKILESKAGQGGSTIVVAWIKERKFFWLSVGDSRIFLCRGGELTQISKDHNYAAELEEKVEAGEITREEAMANPQRAALTSYIGIRELNKIDYSTVPIRLSEGDRILLMSDGVYNTLTVEEMEESMQYAVGKSMVHLGMLVEGKRKRNQDNYTAVMLEMNEEPCGDAGQER